ncbi:MAG: response regulator [Chloroflexi bacterium]|nr:response regulator [Chloroflexota bacterium]
MLGFALKLEGHTVRTYQDSAEFLASVTKEPAPLSCADDLMIIDYHLPGELSGVDVIRQVRAIYPDLPALLISAEHLKTLEAAKEGLSDVKLLLKPVRLSTFLATVKEYATESCI